MSNTKESWACTWLCETREVDQDGIPYTREVECGAPAEEVEYRDGLKGWRCSRGHEHVPIEIAWEPGGLAWQLEQDERF